MIIGSSLKYQPYRGHLEALVDIEINVTSLDITDERMVTPLSNSIATEMVVAKEGIAIALHLIIVKAITATMTVTVIMNVAMTASIDFYLKLSSIFLPYFQSNEYIDDLQSNHYVIHSWRQGFL